MNASRWWPTCVAWGIGRHCKPIDLREDTDRRNRYGRSDGIWVVEGDRSVIMVVFGTCEIMDTGSEVRGLEKSEDDCGCVADRSIAPCGEREKVATHEAVPRRHRAVHPLAAGGVVGENRHGAALIAEALHHLEAEPTKTADNDRLHGGRV